MPTSALIAGFYAGQCGHRPLRLIRETIIYRISEKRAAHTFPRGEGGRAQRGRMRNSGEQLKVCTGLELSGSARIPHPPLRGTLSPGEGIA